MMPSGSAERRDGGGEPAGLGDLSLHWPHQDLQHRQTGRRHTLLLLVLSLFVINTIEADIFGHFK